jgi:hypothetical protein
LDREHGDPAEADACECAALRRSVRNRAVSIDEAVTSEDGTGTRVIASGSSALKKVVSLSMRFASIAVTYSMAFVRSTCTARLTGCSGCWIHCFGFGGSRLSLTAYTRPRIADAFGVSRAAFAPAA